MGAPTESTLITHSVFRGPEASRVFLRPKRANMYLLEEILQGNLERECYEELCTYEEAHEYFEDTKKTVGILQRRGPLSPAPSETEPLALLLRRTSSGQVTTVRPPS